MAKFWVLSLFVMSVFGGFASLMYLKTDVQDLSNQRKSLIKEQQLMRENLKVLKVEFAHLASPNRLYQQAKAWQLHEISPNQVVRAEALPKYLEAQNGL